MKRLLLLSCVLGMSSFCLAQTKKLQVEEDGFKWYKITDGSYCGAETTNGDLVIPLSRQYCDIIYESYGGGICYFNVITGCSARFNSGKVGVCDIFGKEIIPPSYDREKYICFVYATPDEKVNGCTGLHLVDYKDSNYPATIFHINIDSNGKAYRMSNGTKNYISDGKYASSGGGSSSSTSSTYVFEFNSYLVADTKIYEKATVSISKSGKIKFTNSDIPHEFKCTSIKYSDSYISFCYPGSVEYLTMYRNGSFVYNTESYFLYESGCSYTVSGSEKAKNAYGTIWKEVKNKTFIPSALYTKE